MKAKMNATQLRQVLAATRSGLRSAARDRLHVDQRSDAVEEAQWSEDVAVAIEELHIARRHQRDASLALERLQRGTYGICVDCDREISASRLKALPWATRCVRCATIREFADGDEGTATRSVKDWLDAAPDAA